jgi:tetratricopeptide (TPR) repeat protein
MDPNSDPRIHSNGRRSSGIPTDRRRRILLLTAVALVAGGAGATAVALTSGGDGGTTQAATRAAPFKGKPPLSLELPGPAVPKDATPAERLAIARARLPSGDVRIRVGEAIVGYDPHDPSRALAALRALPQDDAVVTFHLGLAEIWAGNRQAAIDAWERTKRLDPFGYYGTLADDALHPPPQQHLGYPPYFPPRPVNGTPAELRAAAQAHPDEPGRWLDLAVALESQDRPAALAAARRAVELDPNGISARVAFLVLSYDKDDPAKTFGQLGPLLQQTGGNTEIRFHLGVLSLWIGLRDKALGEFRQVAKDQPDGPYARFANAFVAELEKPA